MGVPFFVNLAIGLVLGFHGVLIFMEHKRGENLVDWVRKKGQGIFGEDWHVHEYIVGGALLLVGGFFTFMAFAMYAGAHHWWVLKWL
jgi:hypothetical protein